VPSHPAGQKRTDTEALLGVFNAVSESNAIDVDRQMLLFDTLVPDGGKGHGAVLDASTSER